MCVHPKVKTPNATASDINHLCQRRCQERKCQYRNRVDQMTNVHGQQDQTIMDMEELVEWGKNTSVCPFYYSRGNAETAELIFVPYNYLFDKDARSSTLKDIAWDNAVIIFDEAHNLESFASESASFELSNTDIAGCISEIDRAIRAVQSQPGDKDLKESHILKCKELFLYLERQMQNLGPQSAYHGTFIFEFFKSANITHSTQELLAHELRKINDWMADLRGTKRGMVQLEHFLQCLKRVFGHGPEARCLAKASCYRVHVSPKTVDTKQTTKRGVTTTPRTISYWCFAPSLAMEDLADLKVRSILVTSGTLSPLPSYQMELGLPFPHTLENPHIIEDHQIFTRVVGKGPSGKVLSSSFERRKDKGYFVELGNALAGIARVTPGGMLVFFPSYSVMETCLGEWGGPASSRKQNGKSNFFAARRGLSANRFSFPRANTNFHDTASCIWMKMLALKAIVVEPRTSADLPEAMEEFKSFLDLPKSSGCILLGVCRGKISEGIDFANKMSRAVCITGLPFPPAFDPKVKMKREFLDNAKSVANGSVSAVGGFGGTVRLKAPTLRLSGHDWYTQQAHRAVNQAIGRVIRNRSDYGAVILMDERFANTSNQAGLSKWLRPHIKNDDGFGKLIGSLASFYRTAEAESNVRADQEKQRNAAAVLHYEEDEEDDKPQQVAVIQQPPDGQTGTSSYIPPEAVINRTTASLFQRQVVETFTGNTSVPFEQKTLPCLSRHDAAFSHAELSLKGHEAAPRAKSNSTAQEFMDLVRKNMAHEEQSKIKKFIVAMKTAGDQKDVQAYQRLAMSTIRMVLSCEKFEDSPGKESMLFKFFALLPKMYRKSVLVKGFIAVVDLSTLWRYYSKTLDKKQVSEAKRSMATLLYSLWYRDLDIPLPDDAYFRDASPIVTKLVALPPKLGLQALLAYLKLIPQRFHTITQAHYDQLAARNISTLMKQNDRATSKDSEVDNIVSMPKRKLANEKGANVDTFSRGAKKPALSNPYTKKAPPKQVSSVAQNPYNRKPLQQQSVTNSTDKKLRSTPMGDRTSATAFIESIRQQSAYKTSEKKQSPSFPTPSLPCPVCNTDTCDEPFVADCGHVACWKCWQSWLPRSETCVTCRQPTQLSSLARAVVDEGTIQRNGA